MKYYDLVWEDVVITDKDIVEIITHPSMQRLKKIWISTHGYLFNLNRNATRFDHCVGVYLLLKNFGASKEEQIAGLLHDVSHTALSHVSTYAFRKKYTGVEFHEIQQRKFFIESGLAKLLIRLGYNADSFLHDSNYTLLENDLPDICADRLDYALRDGLHLQMLSRQQVDEVKNGLKVYKKEFIFKSQQSAFIYAFNFYILNLLFWGSPAEAHFNNDIGNLVKFAVKEGVLKEKDWFTNDVKLINKLKRSKNNKIISWLAKYNNKLVIYEDLENPDVIFPKKIRIVDPKVLYKSKVRRLSEISPAYNKIINDYKKTHQKHELPIKIVHKIS